MHRRFLRGRLETSAGAPAEGERVTPLIELPGIAIEQILSGSLPREVSFVQDHDEWVLVLDGHARLRVEEEEIKLASGEWLLLPAGCAHTVIATAAGTSWLAVHVGRDG